MECHVGEMGFCAKKKSTSIYWTGKNMGSTALIWPLAIIEILDGFVTNGTIAPRVVVSSPKERIRLWSTQKSRMSGNRGNGCLPSPVAYNLTRSFGPIVFDWHLGPSVCLHPQACLDVLSWSFTNRLPYSDRAVFTDGSL